MGLGIFDERVAVNPAVSLTVADTTVPAYLTQGGGRATRIDAIMLTSDAAGPVEARIVLDNGTPRILGTKTVPAGAGMSGAVPAVDAFGVFPVGPGGLVLAGGTTLKIGVVVTLGAGETLTALAFGGEF